MSDSTGVQEVRDRVLEMAHEIERLAQSDTPPQTFFPEFLRLLVQALGARAGAVWMRGQGGRFHLVCDAGLSETAVAENPRASQLNDKLLGEVMTTGEACSLSPDDPGAELPSNHLLILAALQTGEQPVGVVEIFQRPEAPRQARPGYLQFVEQMCGHASRFLTRQQEQSQTESPGEFWQNFEQFTLQLQRSLNLDEVASTGASDGRLLLGCDRMSVAVKRGRKTAVRAISGQDSVNPRANLVRAMAGLASQVLAMGEPLVYTGRVDDLPPQIEEPLADFVQESGSRMVMLLPLFEPDPAVRSDDEEQKARKADHRRKPVGCLIIEQVSEIQPSPEFHRRAELLADHVAASLSHALQFKRVFLLRLWLGLGRCLEWFHGRKLAKTLAVLAVLLGVGLAMVFVPWDYRVEGKGHLMPVRQRQVFAPWNGEVVEIYVDSGQRVEKGQKLLKLRNDELQERLLDARNKLSVKQQAESALKAQLDRVSPRSSSLTPQEFNQLRGKWQQARIEKKGLEQQIRILEDRLSQLVVHAPIEGVVTTFQIEQLLLDRPVRRGEILVEIMDDTQDWRLELDVEEKRMGHLLQARQERGEPALPVEFVLATNPEATYEGVLKRLATRAQPSSEKGNVVEIHVAIEDDEVPDEYQDQDILPRTARRIGAEVTAKINCGERSLGYVLFGDVIEFVQRYFWL